MPEQRDPRWPVPDILGILPLRSAVVFPHAVVPLAAGRVSSIRLIEDATPGGEAFLVVPPGTTGGQTFRLRGQGLPRLMADGTGDLFVTIQVVMPKGLDERTDELVRQLERLMPMAPRESLERYAGGAG